MQSIMYKIMHKNVHKRYLASIEIDLEYGIIKYNILC